MKTPKIVFIILLIEVVIIDMITTLIRFMLSL